MSAGAAWDVADTFPHLGDPQRIRILDALSGGELCVCDIASLAAISESAVSHQLRLLEGHAPRQVAPGRALVFYALDDQHIIEPAPELTRTSRSEVTTCTVCELHASPSSRSRAWTATRRSPSSSSD